MNKKISFFLHQLYRDEIKRDFITTAIFLINDCYYYYLILLTISSGTSGLLF